MRLAASIGISDFVIPSIWSRMRFLRLEKASINFLPDEIYPRQFARTLQHCLTALITATAAAQLATAEWPTFLLFLAWEKSELIAQEEF